MRVGVYFGNPSSFSSDAAQPERTLARLGALTGTQTERYPAPPFSSPPYSLPFPPRAPSPPPHTHIHAHTPSSAHSTLIFLIIRANTCCSHKLKPTRKLHVSLPPESCTRLSHWSSDYCIKMKPIITSSPASEKSIRSSQCADVNPKGRNLWCIFQQLDLCPSLYGFTQLRPALRKVTCRSQLMHFFSTEAGRLIKAPTVTRGS